MGIPISLVFLTTLLLAGLIVGKTIYYRKKLPHMTGMIIAMTLGMTVGLMMGLILGILFSSHLFFSTVLGMLVGMVIGFLAGLPISVIAVLDGLLSGLMGGMMGAMLGEMITPEYRDSIVKIMFIIFLATLLILLHLLQKEVNHNKTTLYTNPFLVIIFFGLIFIAFDQLGPLFY